MLRAWAEAVERLNKVGKRGGRWAGGILRNSERDMQFAAAPVSYSQVLVTP